MPRLVDRLPIVAQGRRKRSALCLFDWTPYLDGQIWEFDRSELPHDSPVSAMRQLHNYCYHCLYSVEVRVNSDTGTLTMRARPKGTKQ